MVAWLRAHRSIKSSSRAWNRWNRCRNCNRSRRWKVSRILGRSCRSRRMSTTSIQSMWLGIRWVPARFRILRILISIETTTRLSAQPGKEIGSQRSLTTKVSSLRLPPYLCQMIRIFSRSTASISTLPWSGPSASLASKPYCLLELL